MVANRRDAKITGDELAGKLAEVYEVVGPLYRRVFRRVERDAPIDGLSVGVRAVLERLATDGPQTVPQLARAVALSRQFVQRMVNDAAGSGFVEPRRNPAHRRSSLIVLTGAGVDAIERVKAREYEALGTVGDGEIVADDIEATLRVLRHMLAAVEDVEID